MTAGIYNIQFTDLAEQQKRILPNLEKRISRVLSHGKYIMGPEIFELEAKLSKFLGVNHSISCSGGTDALLMVLMALDIGPGDAVFTTPFSFMATAEVISLLGATPVFVDIDPKTYNMDPDCLEKAIGAVIQNSSSGYPLPKNLKTNRLSPKCIIPVDIFGLPAGYEAINRIAARFDLFVLEDAAQSFGAEYQNRKAGKLGHAAATSFFPAKPLGCYGDGGAIFTDDDALARKLESIRVHGKGSDKYDNVRIGLNGRLDTLQAAILLEKFEIFENEIRERNRVASLYSKLLKEHFELQTVPSDCTSVWAQFSVRHELKQKMMEILNRNNIPTAVYYPKPLHCQTAFSYLGYQPDDFPVSTNLSEHIFSLPMHPYLEDGQIHHICDILLKAV
ncbi:MAG: DegT/DnrJ/EryC1/StrS family aminotransferase [Desulfobacula sp.]